MLALHRLLSRVKSLAGFGRRPRVGQIAADQRSDVRMNAGHELEHEAAKFWAATLSVTNLAEFCTCVEGILQKFADGALSPEEAVSQCHDTLERMQECNRGLWTQVKCLRC